MSNLDSNHDGKISVTEWIVGIGSMVVNIVTVIVNLFV